MREKCVGNVQNNVEVAVQRWRFVMRMPPMAMLLLLILLPSIWVVLLTGCFGALPAHATAGSPPRSYNLGVVVIAGVVVQWDRVGRGVRASRAGFPHLLVAARSAVTSGHRRISTLCC